VTRTRTIERLKCYQDVVVIESKQRDANGDTAEHEVLMFTPTNEQLELDDEQ
jgi:hypothetical protein